MHSSIRPEYNLTAHEIDIVNQDRVHALEQERLGRFPVDTSQPNYLPTAVSQKMAIAGSSHNVILDFDHAQDEVMGALTAANDYAYGVKHKVDQMYEEAYAANSHPEGPAKYFEVQKKQHEELAGSSRSRLTKLLGRLLTRSM